MSYTPAIQPENKRQLLARSLRLYRLTFWKVFLLSLAISIVTFIPRIIALYTKYDPFVNLSPFSIQKLWLVLIYFVSLILLTAILWRLHCVSRNMQESLKEDLKKAMSKIFFIFVAVIIQALVIRVVSLAAFGFNILMLQQHLNYHANYFVLLLVYLPFLFELYMSLYLLMLFFFYFPLILTEGNSPLAAFFRSARLVWGHWWNTLIVQYTPWFCYLIVLILLKGIGINTHIYFFDPVTLSPFATLIHILFFALFIPWVAATMLVQLRDLELRKKINNNYHERGLDKNDTLTTI